MSKEHGKKEFIKEMANLQVRGIAPVLPILQPMVAETIVVQ